MATIDQNVVEMRFDNDQFESGVGQTLTSIDKLKNALNFSTRNTGLEELAETTSTMDMSRLEASVLAVQNEFSALGTITDQVLRRLTDGALRATKSLVNMINAPLNQIKTGGWSRAMNIDNAQFSLEGLGIKWDAVNKDLQYAVNQTAYGLDAAASAASQLAASGVEIKDTLKNLTASNVDECAEKFKGMSAAALVADGELDLMAVALRAISGVASQTNSSYDEIANVFTRVAGQGRVMAVDLNSLAARGMNAAATLGEAIGKSEAEVREMVSSGKISFEMFAEAMYDAFADHAIEANNTFTGALANMKAALSKIGADFYQPLLDELPALFNSIRVNINSIRSAIQPFIEFVNQVLKVAIETLSNFFNDLADKTSVVKNVFTGLGNIFIALASLITPIIVAFKDVYNIVGEDILNAAESASEGFLEFTNSLAVSSEAADKITAVAKGLFTVLKTLGDVIGSVLSIVSNVGVRAIKIIFSLADGLITLKDSASEAVSPLESLRTIIGKITTAIKEFTSNLVGMFSKIGDLDGVKKLVEAFKEFKKVFIDSTFDKISAKLKTFADALNIKVPKFDGVLSAIDKITSKLADFIAFLTTAKKNVKTTTDDISKSFSVFTTIKNVVVDAVGGIKKVLGGLVDILKGGTSSAIGGLAEGWIGSIKALASSSNTMSSLSTGVTTIMEFVENFMTNLSLMMSKIQYVIQQVGISIGSMLSSMAIGVGALGTALLVYNQINAKNIFMIAAGVGILSLAMVALSAVPAKKLGVIATGMAIAFTVMAGALYLLNKRVKSVGDVVKAGMLDRLFDTITSVISNFGLATKIGAMATFLKMFAISIGILSASMYALAQCDPGKLVVAMGAVLAMFGAMYLVVDKLIAKVEKMKEMDVAKLTTIGVGMIVIAAAVGVLTSTVAKMTALAENPGELLAGLLAVILMLGSLVVAADALSTIPKDGGGKIQKAALGLVVLSAAVNVLSSAVSKMAGLAGQPLQLAVGLGSVAIMMTTLVVAAQALANLPNGGAGKLVAASAAILILSTSVKNISSAVSKLASNSLGELAKGLGSLTIVLGELVVAAGVLAAVGGAGSIAGAASILLISVALNNLVVPLGIMGSMKLGTIAKGLIAFGAALAVIIVAGGAAQVVAVGLLALSGAVLAIGVGTLAAGAGVLAFASGLNILNAALATLAAMAPAQVNSVIMSFTTLLSGILSSIASVGVSLTAAITTIISSIVMGIANNLTNITEAIAQVLDAILGLLVTYGPKLLETALTILVSLLTSLASHAQEFVTAGMTFITSVINGFASRVGDLVQAGWDAVISLINAMADGLAQNGDRFKEAVANLINAAVTFLFGEGVASFLAAGVELIGGLIDGFWELTTDAVTAVGDLIGDILEGIGKFIGDFVDAGKNLILGFIRGLTGSNSDAYDVGKDLAASAEKGITDEADIHSPSRVTRGYGENMGDGLVNGMNSKQSDAETAGSDLAQAAVDGASKTVDKGKKLINEKLQALYESSETFRNYADKYGESLGLFEKSEKDTTKSTDDLTESTKEATEATEEATAATDSSTSSTKSSSSATSSAAESASELAEKQKVLTKYTKYANATMTQYMKVMGATQTIVGDTTPQEAAIEAFNELAEQIYQDSLKSSDSVEDASQTAEDRAQAVMEAFNEAYESIKDNIESSLDLFSQFDNSLDETVTPKSILKAAESQVDGVTRLSQKYAALAEKGFSEEIIGDIEEEGTGAISKINAMLKMTDDEVLQLNNHKKQVEDVSTFVTSEAMAARATAITISKLKEQAKSQEGITEEIRNTYQAYKVAQFQAEQGNTEMAEMAKNLQTMLQKQCEETGTSVENLEANLNDLGGVSAQLALNLIKIHSEASATLQDFFDKYAAMKDTITDLLDSQISGFDALELKSETTSQTMIDNIKSQIDGLTKWQAEYTALAARGGLSDGILRELAELGVEGYDELHAFYTMTDEQLKQYNALYEQRLTLKETTSTAIATSYATAAIGGITAYNNALVNYTSTGVLMNTAIAAAQQVASALDSKGTAGGSKAGTDTMNAIRQSMLNMIDSVTGQAKQVSSKTDASLQTDLNTSSGQEVGTNYLQGLLNGISDESMRNRITSSLSSFGGMLNSLMASKLGVHSPSRITKAIGVYYMEGLRLGIDDSTDGPLDAVDSVGSKMNQAIGEALTTAVDLMNSTDEMQPTIRPVVDLSDAQNGCRLLSSMFDSAPTLSASANIGPVTTPSDRMNAAISGLNGNSVTNGDTNLYIYGSQGQDVNKLADVVIKKLNNEYARRKAAWS